VPDSSATQAGFFQSARMPDPDWWEVLWPDPAKVLADVGIEPGMRVADLCSGDGWFTLQIARIAAAVIAIDLDPQLLDLARTRLKEAGVANGHFVTSDAYDIAAAVGKPVDHVFLANTFHGAPDHTRLARAVNDALEPDGLFTVINWHDRPREDTTVLGKPRGPLTALRMSPEAAVATVEPAGFKLHKLVDVSPYHYGAVFRRASS